MLYWFRTPPGVRVGRAPIDEEAIRLLEQHNPDIQFDWNRILKDPSPEPVSRRDRDGREGRDRRERREYPRPSDVAPRPVPAYPPAAEVRAAEIAETRADKHAEFAEARAGLRDPEEEVPPADAAEWPDTPPADTDVLASPDVLDESLESPADVPTEPTTAAERPSASLERLGAEGLGRLRARYAEVMARIAEKPMDEPAREQLKLSAERLNPDGWVTADEVTAALEQYETIFESLRAVVGRHPSRRRRR